MGEDGYCKNKYYLYEKVISIVICWQWCRKYMYNFNN